MHRAAALNKQQRNLPSKKALCARSAAAIAIASVLKQEQSLNTHFDILSKRLQTQEIPLFKALCFGVVRHYRSLSAIADQLLEKKIRKKDQDVYALLLIGIYQLDALRVPAYAAVDSCVKASLKLKKPWAKGFLNASLRNFQKDSEKLKSGVPSAALTDHPDWLLKRIQSAWPNYAHAITTANNEEPPLCIRVNQKNMSREHYLHLLTQANIAAHTSPFSDSAIYLDDKSTAIESLPAFTSGGFSVQDEAAQIASEQLSITDNLCILDACAAPGGKTGHILELANHLSVFAIDQDKNRLSRIDQNLDRLQLSAKTQCADITDIQAWWDGKQFDRILCDVPCSATGVIRRHPDIKCLRKDEDIEQLSILQLKILKSLWPCLKPGGILLYTTCSILPDENCEVIKEFMNDQSDCALGKLNITCDSGKIETPIGVQLLPQTNSHDGFYYAKLTKPMIKATL